MRRIVLREIMVLKHQVAIILPLSIGDHLELDAYEKCVELIMRHNPDIIQWDLTFIPEGDCKDVILNREKSDYVELIL